MSDRNDEQQPQEREPTADGVDEPGRPIDDLELTDHDDAADDAPAGTHAGPDETGASDESGESGERPVPAAEEVEEVETAEEPAGDTSVPDADDAETEVREAAPDPLDLSVPLEELDAAPGTPADETEAGMNAPGASPSASEESLTSPDRSFDDLVLERPPSADDEAAAGEPSTPIAAAPPTGWRALGRAMRPRLNRSQLLAALLCGSLGFALVVQVQQSAQDPLTSARQDDLVRLLDEVTQRAEQLDEEVAELGRTRDELASGTGQAQAAVELAEQRAQSEGILSGRLPAVGPGLEIVVRDPSGTIPAAKLFNVLEELRNAGAEVVELNGVRLVTSSWFLDTDAGVTVDGQAIDSPYRWTVIGDPATLNPALEIPGGALAQLRSEEVDARTVEHDEVEITAVREPSEPQYATPSAPEQ